MTTGNTLSYTVTQGPPRLTPTPPATPTGLAATANSSSQITVTWNASSGATSYDMQVDGVLKTGVSSPYVDSGLAASSAQISRCALTTAQATVPLAPWSVPDQVKDSASPTGDDRRAYRDGEQQLPDHGDLESFVGRQATTCRSTARKKTASRAPLLAIRVWPRVLCIPLRCAR